MAVTPIRSFLSEGILLEVEAYDREVVIREGLGNPMRAGKNEEVGFGVKMNPMEAAGFALGIIGVVWDLIKQDTQPVVDILKANQLILEKDDE